MRSQSSRVASMPLAMNENAVIDLAPFLPSLVDQPATERLFSHVAADKLRGIALGGAGLLRGHAAVADAAERDRHALLTQAFHDRATDAGGAARDDGRFAAESSHVRCSSVADGPPVK
jgi:hypothetical protein